MLHALVALTYDPRESWFLGYNLTTLQSVLQPNSLYTLLQTTLQPHTKKPPLPFFVIHPSLHSHFYVDIK